jgi:iron(III) transport system permease protein
MKRINLYWTPFWRVTLIVSTFILLPFSLLVYELIFSSATDAWEHIKEYLLLDYIQNSVILLTSTALLTTLLGFISAYFVSFYDFPYRKTISWLLVAPLAMPSYIAAYIYGDLFSYTGTFTRWLRVIGITQVPDLFSLPGASTILSFTLYPYLYLALKSSMKHQSSSQLESAKLLGAGPFRRFWQLIFPLHRPALVGGLVLVLFETLNDYGVVRYFGVRVFSYAIFDAWYRLGDLSSALRISAITLIVVILIVLIEKNARKRKRYVLPEGDRPTSKQPLEGATKYLIITVLWLIVIIGFLLPFVTIVIYAISSSRIWINQSLFYAFVNTITITFTSSLVIVFLSLMVVNAKRFRNNWIQRFTTLFTSFGYAVPGAVIAVLSVLLFVQMDRFLAPIYEFMGFNYKLVLTSSLALLYYAYIFRFLTISMNLIESTYEKIGTKYAEASLTLGHSHVKTLLKIELPLIKNGLVTAYLIVFIDILKELPLTLILRPTNYNTLAIKAYIYASDEMIRAASGTALIVIVICLAVIYLLTHKRRESKNVFEYS